MQMNQVNNSPTCERANDLVAVLYGEATASETRDFQLHLEQCGACRAEFSSFAQVRQSIGAWRVEALTGFVPAPVRKSAIAALREFFSLSPLWLKGAVGFAAVSLCVLAALAVIRTPETNQQAVYTQQDVNRMLQEALAKQKEAQSPVVEERPVAVQTAPPKNPVKPKAVRVKSDRRPFSKAEREQLATHLRLLSGEDEADLDLFEERINR